MQGLFRLLPTRLLHMWWDYCTWSDEVRLDETRWPLFTARQSPHPIFSITLHSSLWVNVLIPLSVFSFVCLSIPSNTVDRQTKSKEVTIDKTTIKVTDGRTKRIDRHMDWLIDRQVDRHVDWQTDRCSAVDLGQSDNVIITTTIAIAVHSIHFIPHKQTTHTQQHTHI